MITSTELVERLETKHGNVSAYRVAKIYGWGNARILNWKAGRAAPDQMQCIRIADELGLSRGYVLSCMEAQRQSEPEVAEAWAAQAALTA